MVRRSALLAVGLLLVTTPVWAPALDVTGRDHVYRAATVTVDDDRVRVPGDHPRFAGLDGVDCLREIRPTRRCVLESRLLRGSVRAPYPGVGRVVGDPSLAAPERHVAFAGDGRVFRRTVEWNGSAGAYVVGLERANASRVLAGAARPTTAVRPPVRRAAETGTARAGRPLPEAVLVETDGGYRAVYEARSRTLLSADPPAERALELLAVGLGAALLVRAGRGADGAAG